MTQIMNFSEIKDHILYGQVKGYFSRNPACVQRTILNVISKQLLPIFI